MVLATAWGGSAESAEVSTPVARAAGLAGASAILLAIARLVLNGPSDPVVYTLALSGVGFGISAVLAHRKHRAGVFLLPWVGMFGVFGMALYDSGLQSEALPWAPFVAMLIPICLRGIPMVFAGVVVLLLPCVLLFSAEVMDSALWLRWFGVEGALIFGIGLARAFMSWRRESLSELQQEHSRLQFVIDNLRSGIAVTNREGLVVAVNARLLHLFKFEKQNVIGERFVKLLQASTKSVPKIDGASDGDDSSALDQVTVGDRVYEVRCDTHGTEETSLVLWSFHEVTRRHRSYAEALGRLEKDALTGLYNRSHLLRELKDATSREQPFALLFIDLDGFKPINDSMGHAAGDAILRTVASRLRSVMRGGDVVCRLGGDEFCVITHGVRDRAQAGVIAEKIIAALRRPYEGVTVLGSSVGIALYPHVARHPDSLLHRADIAMYAAKRKGGNRWAMSRPSMDMETVALQAPS